MTIFNQLDIYDTLAFLVGLTIGIFLTYIYKPPPQIIIKHPTPENTNKIIYKNNDGSCYKYKATEVKCENYDVILEHPVIIH